LGQFYLRIRARSATAVTQRLKETRHSATRVTQGGSRRPESDALADYTGELQPTTTVRITDKRSGTGVDAATVEDLSFPVKVPCTATAGSAGATCNVTTTFDAVTPGVIAEGRRSIWEFDRVRVNDGGSDGLVATAPNDLFATQGIFVP
jgi:hypothetical protein